MRIFHTKLFSEIDPPSVLIISRKTKYNQYPDFSLGIGLYIFASNFFKNYQEKC